MAVSHKKAMVSYTGSRRESALDVFSSKKDTRPNTWSDSYIKHKG
jgi:hypothetical protein